MDKSILVLIFLIAIYTQVRARNPGLKLRLSEKGLDYGAKVAIDKLSAKVTGQKIPDQSGTSHVAVGKVEYQLSKILIKSFTRPGFSVTTDANKGLTLTLNDIGLSIHGDWRYKYKAGFISIKDSGSFDLKVNRVTLQVSVNIGSDDTGRPVLSTRSCNCRVGDVDVKFHGGTSWLYNLFRKEVEKPIANSIQSQLCKSLQQLINVNANKSLRKMKVRIPVEGLLTLDFRLTAPPLFGSNYLETQHRGEFYWTANQTEPPFQPNPIADLPKSQKMVTFYISDYVGNSLGYVFYTYGSRYMSYNLTKKDLPEKYQHFLNSSTFPPIEKKFPNSTIQLDLTATHRPCVKTENNKTVFELWGQIEFKIRQPEGRLLKWFRANMKFVALITGNMTGQRVIVQIEKHWVRFNITKTYLQPVPGESLLRLILKVATDFFIIPKLNMFGQKGLLLPRLDHVDFIDPDLHFVQGALCFTTNLKYDPN